jgi:MFS superfamily sulfate permease-like transporter
MLPLRILAIAVLVVSLLIDTADFQDIIKPDVQIILGVGIVAIIMFVDSITGLILGITILIIYLRVYAKMYNINLESIVDIKNLLSNYDDTNTKRYSSESLVDGNYITPKNLEDAQNNVFDKNKYETELIGIKGIYGKGVYGAQGFDKELPGFVDDSTLSSPAEFTSA